MNAACLAYGMAIGGRQAARHVLAAFWERVADVAAWSPLQPSWHDRLTSNWGLEWSPAFLGFDMVSRLFSPYEFNPLNLNPLRDALVASVDFQKLQTSPVHLFLAATNVRTGKVKIFQRGEICADAVLASACLPFLFQAIEIDGEDYWDGGYMGNPAIFPLIYECESRDVVVVHINPIERPELPRTAREILNRVNEISFNSSLDAGDAGDPLRHQADRERRTRRGAHEADAYPRYLSRRADGTARRQIEAECRAQLPGVSARSGPDPRRGVA